MLKYLCSLVLVASHYLLLAQAGTFTTLPTQIDSTGYSHGVNSLLTCCYNSANNQVFFCWAASTSPHNPWYCIYNVNTSSFSTLPIQIDSTGYTAAVQFDVFSCYNSLNNQFVLSWVDNTSHNPWYCIYDVKSNSFSTPPTRIDSTGYTLGVYHDIYCCYNSMNNQVFFCWSDNSSSHNPWYCIYDVKSNSFSTPPTHIDPTGYKAKVADILFCCYNSLNNQVVFSWADGTSSHNPWYCIYDASRDSFSTLPTQIDAGGYTLGVNPTVFSSYNSSNNQVLFSWKTTSNNPWYCIYDANRNLFSTQPTRIDSTGYTLGVEGDLFSCYNRANNQVFFSWADNTSSHNPWYCIYDVYTSTFTTLPTRLDATGYSLGVSYNMFCCYNSTNNQVIFSWPNSSHNPWYAIYTQPFPPGYLQKALSQHGPLQLLKGFH